MTQMEWETLMKTNSPMPGGSQVIDYLPYPALDKKIDLSFWDIQTIRALAAWGAIAPYRTIRIDVWSRTKVNLMTYERNTIELRFTKDASGWHMEALEGIIDWASESAMPTISFH
jgi:hypothetical protein